MTDDVGGGPRYDAVPSALILADSEAGGDASAESVIAAGGRVAARLGLEDMMDGFDRQVMADLVMIDLSVDDGPATARLLDLFGDIAIRSNYPLIVSVNFALIDCAAARLNSGPVTLLCEPDLVDRVSALALAWGEEALLGVSDVSAEADNARLRRLSEEVGRIARALAKLSNDKPSSPSVPAHRVADVQSGFSAEPVDLAAPGMPSADAVRDILRRRRMRNRYFDANLFADPAWDMLLDLMAARLEGEEVSVSSLSIAASVPSTTALRWIRNMTDLGLFDRRADPADGRRVYIHLTDAAASAMASYLIAASRQNGVII